MADYRDGYIGKLNGESPIFEVELLSMLLGNAFNGKDMTETARRLLGVFPSIGAILEADITEILAVKGVTDRVAVYLKTVGRIAEYGKSEPSKISSSEDFFEIIADRFRNSGDESVELFFVNKSGKITDVRTYSSRSADRVEVYSNDVLSAISASKAYGLYCAHNHVNAPAKPSSSDDETTRKILRACDYCGVKFFDHCIINSSGECYSYAAEGRLSELGGKAASDGSSE